MVGNGSVSITVSTATVVTVSEGLLEFSDKSVGEVLSADESSLMRSSSLDVGLVSKDIDVLLLSHTSALPLATFIPPSDSLTIVCILPGVEVLCCIPVCLGVNDWFLPI